MEWSGQKNTAASADKTVDIRARVLEWAKRLKGFTPQSLVLSCALLALRVFLYQGFGPSSVASSSISPGVAVKHLVTRITTKQYTCVRTHAQFYSITCCMYE